MNREKTWDMNPSACPPVHSPGQIMAIEENHGHRRKSYVAEKVGQSYTESWKRKVENEVGGKEKPLTTVLSNEPGERP